MIGWINKGAVIEYVCLLRQPNGKYRFLNSWRQEALDGGFLNSPIRTKSLGGIHYSDPDDKAPDREGRETHLCDLSKCACEKTTEGYRFIHIINT